MKQFNKANKFGDFGFRTLTDDDIDKIHKYQNTRNGYEISWLLDLGLDWIPYTKDKIKSSVEELNKNDNNHIFAMVREEDFIGVVVFYSDWDPLCPGVQIFIWPEFRRRGHGSTVAKSMLDKIFNQYHGHKISTGSANHYEPGLKFIESLGFKPAGVMRRVAVHEGKYSDWVVYDMLRSEYQETIRRGH